MQAVRAIVLEPKFQRVTQQPKRPVSEPGGDRLWGGQFQV